MSNPIPSDDEIHKILEKIMDYMSPIFTKLSGEKVPKKLSKKNKNILTKRYKEFAKIGQEFDFLNNATLPTNYKLKKLVSVYDKFLRKHFDIDYSNPVEFYLETFDYLSTYEKIAPSKQYAKRKQGHLHEIFFMIGKHEKEFYLEKFLNSLNLDVLYSSHQGAERLNEDLDYILRPRKRFTKNIVENYLGICKEIASFFEPFIIILYGLKKIIDGKYVSFYEIKQNRKLTIGKMVNELKNVKHFKELIGIYSNLLRNSIIHGDYHMDLQLKEIEFNDIDRKLTLSFEEFVLYTQELTRRAIILSHIEMEYYFLLMKNYNENRKQILNLPD